jgi:quinol monooxygenase YgiN
VSCRYRKGCLALSGEADAGSREENASEQASFDETFRGRTMPTIVKGRAPLTLINVFTVAPEKQGELIELLTQVTEHNVRHHKGFVSASLHRAIDGRKVTMYAQWASVEDYETMRRDSGSTPALEQALRLATFDPGMYEVVEIFLPGN